MYFLMWMFNGDKSAIEASRAYSNRVQSVRSQDDCAPSRKTDNDVAFKNRVKYCYVCGVDGGISSER